jgi:hypothetical protein
VGVGVLIVLSAVLTVPALSIAVNFCAYVTTAAVSMAVAQPTRDRLRVGPRFTQGRPGSLPEEGRLWTGRFWRKAAGHGHFRSWWQNGHATAMG